MALLPSSFLKRTVYLFDWELALTDLDVNEPFSVFKLLNIHIKLSIIYDDREPFWMNRHVKDLILYNAKFYKKFVHGKNSMFHLFTFNNMQNHLNQFIS